MLQGSWRTAHGRRSQHRAPISTIAVAAVVGVLLLLAAVSIDRRPSTVQGDSTDGDGDAAWTGSPRVGAPAPDFTAVALDGSPVRLNDLRGRPVWLTFNESWCQACRAENPDIDAAAEAARPFGLVVIAIFVSEDSTTVTEYLRRAGLHFEAVADPDRSIGDQYRVAATPTHYFIDRSGNVSAIAVGGLDPAGLDAAWRRLVDGPTDAGG